MRKKITIGVGLIAVMLAVFLLRAWWLSAAEPPLRAAMSEDEVNRAVGDTPTSTTIGGRLKDKANLSHVIAFTMEAEHYLVADWRGHRHMVQVCCENKGRLTAWTHLPLEIVRVRRLAQAVKFIRPQGVTKQRFVEAVSLALKIGRTGVASQQSGKAVRGEEIGSMLCTTGAGA